MPGSAFLPILHSCAPHNIYVYIEGCRTNLWSLGFQVYSSDLYFNLILCYLPLWFNHRLMPQSVYEGFDKLWHFFFGFSFFWLLTKQDYRLSKYFLVLFMDSLRLLHQIHFKPFLKILHLNIHWKTLYDTKMYSVYFWLDNLHTFKYYLLDYIQGQGVESFARVIHWGWLEGRICNR